MPIGISSGTIRNKKATVKFEDKVKKIVQTYGNLYFLSEKGILSGIGLNNSVQITGSNLTTSSASYAYRTVSGRTETIQISGSFIPEWDLEFSLIFTNLFTPNLNYIYSRINKIFNEHKILDFDAGYTYINNKDFIVSIFKNFCFFINENGELYGWGFNANKELSISSDITGVLRLPSYQTNPNAWEFGSADFPTYRPNLKILQESLQNKTVFRPTKLNNITNWTSVVANNVAEYYKHILLNSNGEIYTFGGDLNPPVKMGSNSDWKYISYDYAINNNNELYRLRDATREYTGLIKIGTNEWKTVDKHADYAIKLDNTLWSISGVPFQIGTDTDYENVFYGTPVRTTDPFDIKITTTQYFSSTDTDSITSLSVIKPERTVLNLREYDYNAKFIGVSANTLHGTVTDYTASPFNSQNYKLNQTISVKY